LTWVTPESRQLPSPEAEQIPPRRQTQQEQSGVRYVYPLCDKCQREVRAFAWSDHREADGSITRTFFAYCHGETEVVHVPLAELRQMRGFEIQYAFGPKTLPPAPDSSPQVKGFLP
jgi:hypothetical protein